MPCTGRGDEKKGRLSKTGPKTTLQRLPGLPEVDSTPVCMPTNQGLVRAEPISDATGTSRNGWLLNWTVGPSPSEYLGATKRCGAVRGLHAGRGGFHLNVCMLMDSTPRLCSALDGPLLGSMGPVVVVVVVVIVVIVVACKCTWDQSPPKAAYWTPARRYASYLVLPNISPLLHQPYPAGTLQTRRLLLLWPPPPLRGPIRMC